MICRMLCSFTAADGAAHCESSAAQRRIWLGSCSADGPVMPASSIKLGLAAVSDGSIKTRSERGRQRPQQTKKATVLRQYQMIPLGAPGRSEWAKPCGCSCRHLHSGPSRQTPLRMSLSAVLQTLRAHVGAEDHCAMQASTRPAKKRRTDLAPTAAGRAQDGLTQEISAFAAQLGLASGQPAQGFDDRDFRPRPVKQAGSHKRDASTDPDTAETSKAARRPVKQSRQAAAASEKPGRKQDASKAQQPDASDRKARYPQASVKPILEEEDTHKPRLTGEMFST